MKRFVTYLALLAMLANSASAGLIVQGSVGADANAAAVAIVPTINNYTPIVFKLTGYNNVGQDDTVTTVFGTGTNSISSMAGTWTSTNGSMFFSDDDGSGSGLGSGNQAANTIISNVNSAAQLQSYRSFMNFSGVAGNPTPAVAVAEEITSFNYSWFTTGSNLTTGTNANRTRLTPNDELAGTFDQTLIGRIWITPGATLTFTGTYSSAVGVNQPVTFSFTDGVVNPTNDPVAVTANPVTTTARTATAGSNTVVVSNAAVAVNPRDTAVLSAVTVTTAGGGTFSQTGMSNGNIAPGASQTATIAFNKTGLLNGYTATGNLSFAIAGGATPGGTGIGNYTYPLSQVVSGNTGNGTAPIAAGGSYAGLSGTSDLVSVGGSVHLPSSFTILGGTNAAGGATTVSGVWSLRAANEQVPGSIPPPRVLPDFAGELTSDRLTLTGMDGDIFVLQMTYDPTRLTGNEAEDAQIGHLFVASQNPQGNWVNAIALNHGANVGAANVQGAWSGQLQLGTWGVDIANNNVWAVLDHNSLFASVPEPSTILLGLMGLVGLVGFARRRRS